MSVSGPGYSAATVRFLRVAILTAAGAFGTTSHAEAALYYWQDYSDGFYYARQPRPVMQRTKPHKRGAGPSKKDVAEKEVGAKPQGPLVISVSIDRQKVTIYDDNGVFAEAPVSTGMKGHPTPMGVFSVIQKQKFHRSNIYSGAPMPFMQRITWSGVAMHAGVLPGYPASHGCIRMPPAFAVKMYKWTRMGARVIVAPGDAPPASFTHPLLATFKVPPQPTASLEPQVDAPLGAKGDKGAQDTGEIKTAEIQTASSDPVIELRSTVGHSPATLSDATTDNAMAREDAPKTDGLAASKAEDTGTTAEAAEPSKPQSVGPAGTDAKPAEAADAAKATAAVAEKPAEKLEPAKTGQVDAAKPEASKADASKPETAKTEATEVKKPDAAVTATTPAPAAAPDAAKDQTRLAEPAPAAKPDTPKETPKIEASKSKAQIAVFISRKDSKLYVRQNFAPLFDVPVTIAASDRPLGTHIFTAEVDKDDPNALHWSVVSLPVSLRVAEREDERHMTRRHRTAAAVIPVAAKSVIAPDSPAEALDRISIPPDTMATINEMLTTGSSIIVSDQGINQGETGEGTDFIVRLR